MIQSIRTKLHFETICIDTIRMFGYGHLLKSLSRRNLIDEHSIIHFSIECCKHLFCFVYLVKWRIEGKKVEEKNNKSNAELWLK